MILQEYTTEQLTEQIKDVDFFGTPSNSEISISEEIHRRSIPQSSLSAYNIDTEKVNCTVDQQRESAEIRSWIVSTIGQKAFYEVRTKHNLEISVNTRKHLELIAEQLNNTNESSLSQHFINTFSTSNYFLVDDIINIITTVKSLNDTENEIREITAHITDEINSMIQLINSEQYHQEQVHILKSDTDFLFESEIEFSDIDDETKSTIDEIISYFTEQSSNFEKCSSENVIFENDTPIQNVISPKKYIEILLLILFLLYKKVVSMSTFFKLDDLEFKQMEQRVKDAPKQFSFAVRKTLTNMAYDLRQESLIQVDKEMTIRNKTLARKSITYRPATGANIRTMKSIVGTAPIGNRFSGLGEQESSTVRAKRKRVITEKGRGAWRRKLAKRRRMNSEMADVSQLLRPGSSKLNSDRRVIAMLSRRNKGGSGRVAARYGDNLYFKMTRSRRGANLAQGVYKFRGFGKSDTQIENIQNAPKNRTLLQPRRNKWLTKATRNYLRSNEPNKHYRTNIRAQVRFLDKFRF